MLAVATVLLVVAAASCARAEPPAPARAVSAAQAPAPRPAAPTTQPQDTWTGIDRIVAVGDIHGDIDQLVKTLRAAGVIDEKEHWIAGKTHLVQVGDTMDRGPNSRKVLDLLMALEPQAAAAGGAVHALIGNHEAMVMTGDYRYVNPADIRAWGGQAEYQKALGPHGAYGRWILTHNAIIKINDLLFLHGGLTAKFADWPLAKLNQTIREEIRAGKEEGVITDPAGPLWDRHYARDALAAPPPDGDAAAAARDEEAKVAAELSDVLKKQGAAHMVIGHTYDKRGVLVQLGGRVIRIDVGLSAVYGGPAACLVVEKGVFYEVRAPDQKTRLDLAPTANTPPTAPAGN
jgi:hypothetical protein